MKKRIGIAALLLTALVASGCGASSAKMEMATADSAAAMTEEMAEDNGYVTAASGLEAPKSTGQKLIKTVSLSMQTRKFDELLEHIQTKVTESGGYTESSDISGNSYYGDGNRYAWLSLRIPADKLDSFVTVVSELGNVTSKNESVEDITLKYVDTESHKKALETEQERLLTLMEQAESMDDIIKIETRLSEIRYELQSYESTLRTYDNQVSYSTVSISINEVDRETAPEKQGFAEELKNRLSDNLYHISHGLRNFAIWFIAAIPYFLILGVIGFAVIKLVRKIIWKKPMFHKKKKEE